jgi:hypothetical protein
MMIGRVAPKRLSRFIALFFIIVCGIALILGQKPTNQVVSARLLFATVTVSATLLKGFCILLGVSGGLLASRLNQRVRMKQGIGGSAISLTLLILYGVGLASANSGHGGVCAIYCGASMTWPIIVYFIVGATCGIVIAQIYRERKVFVPIQGEQPLHIPESKISSEETSMTTVKQIDLFRYHDLTKRLAAFSTEGGDFLRGDEEDLQVSEGEPRYGDGEEEKARIAGIVTLVGSRSTSKDDQSPSLGLVAQGPALVIITSERLILMFRHGSASQLGSVDTREVHTFVLPWDLIDSIAIPQRKSMTDRIAGTRTLEVYSAGTGCMVKIAPRFREVEGRTEKLKDDDAMALLVSSAVTHRISVSPSTSHARLHRLLDGSFSLDDDGDLIAYITDPETADIPEHLVGRLVERRGAKKTLDSFLQ